MMKTKKFGKILSLEKETISNLGHFLGGVRGKTLTCQTFDLSNCETWEFQICNPCNSRKSVCLICV